MGPFCAAGMCHRQCNDRVRTGWIYYMELPGGDACAFIGSHNVTAFALTGLNGEAAVLAVALLGSGSSRHAAL